MKAAYSLIDRIVQALDSEDFCGVVGFCSPSIFSTETVRMFASCEWVLSSSKVFEGFHSLSYTPSGSKLAPGGWPLLRELTCNMLDKITQTITSILPDVEKAVLNPPFIIREWTCRFLNSKIPSRHFALAKAGGFFVFKVPCDLPKVPLPEVAYRTRYIRADRKKVLNMFAIGLECDFPILEVLAAV